MVSVTDVVQLAPGVRLSAMDTGTLEKTYIAQTPDGRQLQLSESLYHLMKCMDSPRSLATLADDFRQQTGKTLSEDELGYLVNEVLRPKGLLAGEQTSDDKTSSNRPSSALALHLKRDLIQPRHLYPITRVLSVFFMLPFVVVLLPFVVVAHVVTYLTLGLLSRLDAASVPLFWVYALVLVSILLHEMGHLSACRRWQCLHGPLGVGLYFFSPVFYVDVSPAWQLSRWKRVLVDVGGMYFQLLFTIVLCAAFWMTRQVVFLWIIVVIDMFILRNLVPLIKLDGYWLLSDLVGVPNLHKRTGEAIKYIAALPLHWLGIRKQLPILGPFWQVKRLSRVSVFVYVAVSVVLMPLFFGLMIPVLFQVLVKYPPLWKQSLSNLVGIVHTFDALILVRELGHLLFPALILINLGVLAVRLLAPVKNLFTRRILMNDKVKWILIGSGIGIVVATLAIGLTLLIVRPNLRSSSDCSEGCRTDAGGLPVGQAAPDFAVADLDGNTVRLSDFRGQPVLLRFWSPECPPCASEASDLQEIYERLGSEIVFLTISAATPVGTTRSFVSERQITYPVLPDEDGHLMDKYQVKGIPFTFLIDADGVIQKTVVGTRDRDRLEKEIADFLALIRQD